MATTVNLKPKTRASYESLLRSRILPSFENVALAAIQPSTVKHWIAELEADGLSASRVRQAYNLFGAIMRGAVEDGCIASTPCVGVKLPRLPKLEMLFLDATQVEAIVSAIGGSDGALIYVLAYGGLRFGEAVALRRRHVDLLRSRLLINESLAEVGGRHYFGPTKTHRHRVVPVPAFLKEALSRHLTSVPGEGDALVFTSRSGKPIRYSNFMRRQWAPALKRAGLPPVGIHVLRHTCAALLIAEGAYPKEVQEHLGHSSIAVTMDRYGHLFPDSHDRIARRLEAAYEKGHDSASGVATLQISVV
jgi:integrase